MTTLTLNQVEQLADRLPPHQQLALIRHLALQLAARTPRLPSKSLANSWKGVPDDFDLDAALKEIRSEWLEELDELHP
jgi:hypothetical protein